MTRVRGMAVLAAAMLIAVAAPALAKKPAIVDETAVRGIIQQVYSGYARNEPDSPETASEKFQPPYSVALDALIKKWMPLGTAEEVIQMNSFDWYCQCQDHDPQRAKVVTQKYDARTANTIEAMIEFAPMGGKGRLLTFLFIRENGQWVMDDLRFAEGNTLREGLQEDVNGAALTNAT